MSFMMSIFSIIFGFLFIIRALGTYYPVIKKNSKLYFYDGIITDIEEKENAQIIKIQYEKEGKPCEGLYYNEYIPDSIINFKFNSCVGTKVRFCLNENSSINSMTILREEDNNQSNVKQNDKGKINWGLLFFGMFLFIFGIYYCIQNIYWLLVQ